MNTEEFDCVMDINLKGVYFACQSVGKYMKENRIKGSCTSGGREAVEASDFVNWVRHREKLFCSMIQWNVLFVISLLYTQLMNFDDRGGITYLRRK